MSIASSSPIPAPSEQAFTDIFGRLLPPAKYLVTDHGKAAYYDLPPASSEHASKEPSRVLVIHGISTPALGMLPLSTTLHETFPTAHFVLFDLWGHGLSETPILPHTSDLFHTLIDTVLDQLDWQTCHLIGYSLGAVLTAGYVASYPDRIQSFTLIAPAGLIRTSGFTEEQRGYLHGSDETAARKRILEFLEGGDLIVPEDWRERVANGEVVAEAVKEWQLREHAGHAASVVAMFRDVGVLDNDVVFREAVQSGIRSLVVLGELDEVCSDGELRDIGFKNLFVVQGVGHAVVRQRVSEVAKLITDFWTSFEL